MGKARTLRRALNAANKRLAAAQRALRTSRSGRLTRTIRLRIASLRATVVKLRAALGIGSVPKPAVYAVGATAGVVVAGAILISVTLGTVTGTVAINNGAAATTTSTVTLNSSVTGATQMRVGPPLVKVAAGQNACVAIADDGTLWAWGAAPARGNGSTPYMVDEPVQISTATDWAQVFEGGGHSAAIKADGTLYMWGTNTFGQVGNGTPVDQYLPVRIGAAGAWKTVALGNQHSVGLKKDGTLWVWGYNANYQLGTGNTSTYYAPFQIGGTATYTAVGAGIFDSYAIKADGSLYSWGYNNLGQGGVGTTTNLTTPTFVSSGPFASVIGGPYAAAALKTDGTLWTWGNNGIGTIGQGVTTQQNTPKQASAPATFTEFTMAPDLGGYQLLATKADGTLWATGNNSNGQLGLGDTVNRNTLTQVGMSTGWSSPSVGGPASMAFNGGSLYTWGAGRLGQLSSQRTVPQAITTTWTAYTASSPWTLGSAEGTQSVLVYYKDGSGGSLVASDSIFVDLTPPSGTMVVNGGESVTNTTSVVVQSSVTNAVDMRIGSGAWQPYASLVTTSLAAVDGPQTVTVSYRDEYARTLDLTDTIVLDTTPPAGSIILNGGVSPTKFRNIYLDATLSGSPFAQRPTSYAGWKYVSTGGSTLGVRQDGTGWGTGYNVSGSVGDSSTVTRTSFVPFASGPSAFKEVLAVNNASYGIGTDGSLWAWGANSRGQLGDGTLTQRISPVRVGSATDWKSVRGGGAAAYAMKTDGSLWAFGDNQYGQLGIGSTTPSLSTTPVRVGSGSDYFSDFAPSMYQNHVMAVKTDGSLWGWGYNSMYNLGDGTMTQRNSPWRIGTDSDWAACGANAYGGYAIKTDGSLWGWGYNAYGQVGDGTTLGRSVPTRVGTDTNWKTVVGGMYSGMAMKTDGSIWSWGDNGYGQLGQSTTLATSSPARIGTRNDYTQISLSWQTACALTTDGRLWCWGANGGLFGDSSTSGSVKPVTGDWQAFNAHQLVTLTGANGLKTVGYVYRDQAGNETTLTSTIVLDTTIDTGTISVNGGAQYATAASVIVTNSVTWASKMRIAPPIVSVSGGDRYGIAYAADGTVWGTGANIYGALGTNSSSATFGAFSGSGGWASAVAGQYHSLLLKRDGTLWGLGSNYYGELGTGSTGSPQHTVQSVVATGTWQSVSAGNYTSAGIKTDGSLWTWGMDGYGQLGDGAYSSRALPYNAGSNFKMVSCGPQYTIMAVKNDGSLWGSGYNYTGQIGDGTGINRTTFTRSGTGNNWLSVSTGYDHTVALQADGSLWAMGVNTYGQLGDGTTTQRYSPVLIGTGYSWAVAGMRYTLAVKGDGTLWSWGQGNVGQLGDGLNTGRFTPQQVGTDADWVSVGVANGVGYATKTDGTLWSWGAGTSGELGSGSYASRTLYGATNLGAFSAYAGSSSYSPAYPSGLTTVFATFKDNGGNSVTLSDDIFFDLNVPSTTATGFPAGGWATAPVVAALLPSDSESGIFATWYAVNGGSAQVYSTPLPFSTEGTTTLTYRSQDKAGNSETTKTATIRIDTVAPSTTTTFSSAWTNDNTGYLVPSDQTSGVFATYYKTPLTAVTTSTGTFSAVDGSSTVTYWSVDNAGNVEASHTITTRVDWHQPVTTCSALPGDWATSAPVTLDATDTYMGAQHSGVAATYYTIDGGAPQTYTGTFLMPDGIHALRYWSVDNAGNTELKKGPFTVKVDATAPVTGSTVDGAWHATPTHVVLTPSDSNSGVLATYYQLNGGAAQPYLAPFDVATEGTTTLTWWSVDNLGNAETPHTLPIQLDYTKPVSTLTGVPAETTDSVVTLKLAATDGAGSGVGTVYYALNGGAPHPYTADQIGLPITAEGTTTISYWSVDAVGNAEASRVQTFTISYASYTTNGSRNPTCIGCHSAPSGPRQVRLNFSVAPVDRTTACPACHPNSLAGTHPYHNTSANCGAICHLGWGGGALQTAIPSVQTTAGAFAALSSRDLTADQLHLIHSQPRWPQNVDYADSRCASCHAAAACDACHQNGGVPVADTHALHSSTGNANYPAAQTPVSRTVGYGVPGGNQAVLSSTPETKMCGTVGCHNTAGLKTNDPLFYENFSHPASPTAGAGDNMALVKTGTWRTTYNMVYTSGQMCYSSSAGSTFQVTVSGIKASFVSETGPARGKADIVLDGTTVATVDCYSPTTKTQAVVWTSGSLAAGSHTILVKVDGTTNPASTGTSVVVDRFWAWTSLADKVAPLCTSCHPDRAAVHGYTDVDHVADVTSTVEPLSGATCSACHSMDLLTEHEKPTSSSAGRSCANCHEWPRNTFASWNQTCVQGGCHTPGSTQAMHGGLPARHTPTGAIVSCVRNCHTTNLATEHANANHAQTVTCVQCHNSPEFKALPLTGWDGTCTACHATGHADPSETGNQLCFDCHGSSDSTMTAIAGAGAYGATGGDHQSGYDASAHSSATLPAGNLGDVQSGIQCEVCHNKQATSSTWILDLRTGGGDPSASVQSALCLRCHSASGDETATPKPNTWNGRDIATEFARPSHHPVVGATDTVTTSVSTVTAFSQFAGAQFAADSSFQLGAGFLSGAQLEWTTYTVTPGKMRLLHFMPTNSPPYWDQLEPSSGQWNTYSYDPPDPSQASYVSLYRGAMTVLGNNAYLLSGNNRYRYTPPDGTSPGTWTTLSYAPTYSMWGPDEVSDEPHGLIYHMLGSSPATVDVWRASDDTWSTIQGSYGGGSVALGQNACIAYSPEADKLFVKPDWAYGNGSGRLLSLSSPSTNQGSQPFADTGVQLATGSQAYWPVARMVRFAENGHDYLAYVGKDASGTLNFSIVGNLTGATQTLKLTGSFPWATTDPRGSQIAWDGGDYLYVDDENPVYDWNWKRIKIPADPMGTWPAWENVPMAPHIGSSGMMAALDATQAPYQVVGYRMLGTLSATVDAPIGATAWGTLSADTVVPTKTGLSVRVEGWSGGSWVTVPGLDSVTSFPADLSTVSAVTYPRLRLTANLTTWDTNVTPALRSWSLTANCTGPKGDSSASLSCASCHNPHEVAVGDGAAWDVARVSDPTNTKNGVATTTEFCLDCHSARVVSAGTSASSIVPFGVRFTTFDPAALFPGWDKAAGSTSFLQSGHYTTTGTKALCETCHDPHGSNNANLTAWTLPSSWTTGTPGTRDNTSTAAAEQNLCYQCHGNGTVGKQAPGAQDVASPMSGTYRHSQSPSGKHSDTETVSDLATNRHAECVDCHDPHAAQPGTHAQGTSFGPVMLGATGVTPTWGSTQFSAVTTVTPMRITGLQSDAEADVCFKCHLAAQHTVTRPDASTYTATDLGKEFNPNNASYHNVLGLSVGMRGTYTISGTTFTWSQPAESRIFVNGWHYNSKVTCSDCHTGGSAGQAKGPHGSSVPYMLDPAYPVDWKSSSLDPSHSGGIAGNAQIICVKCHVFTGNTNGVHDADEYGYRAHGNSAYPCTACHIAIPHGWKRPRLLVNAGDPAPYAQLPPYGRYINQVNMRTHTADNWSSSDCNSSCYSHNGGLSNPMP